MTVPVVLDCDPGHDDAVAIAVAAYRARLIGVTTVAGNVGLDLTTHNALGVLELLDLDVPVHSGAAVPLAAADQAPRHAEHVHGETGLAGAVLPEVTRTVESDDAVGYLIDVTKAVAGLWIVATGPLTNVALALERDPELAHRIAGISIMGGGTFGNVTAAAEFNIHFDPEAADVVLRCGSPRILMCGLDLTHQFGVDDEFVARLRDLGNRFGPFCAGFLAAYLENVRALTKRRDVAALHDPCAVLAVTDPELFAGARVPVDIETKGEHTRGMTLVDRRSWTRGHGNVEWAEHIDAAPAFEVVTAAIAAAP
ncbi:MAG TPA: nucleoside hydrolase [Acidimicrobiia bacterium]